MADETVKIANALQLAEALKKLEDLAAKGEITSQKFDSQMEAIKKASLKITGSEEPIKKVSESVKNFFDEIKNLSASSVTKTFTDFSDTFASMGAKLANFSIAYVGLSKLPQPDQLFKGFVGTTDTLNNLQTSASNVTSVLESIGVPRGLTQVITTVAAGEQRFNGLAQGMYSTAAASGNLSKFLDEVGDSTGKIDMSRLVGKMEDLEKISYNTAKSTNANLTSVREFASTLEYNVPGALDETNNFIMKSGEQLNALEGTMKVAAGAGIKTADAITYAGMAFEDFNLKPQEAAENLASMAATADSLGMKSKFMTSYVNETAKSFMYFKDNTQALIRVMGNLAPAFQAAKLSPQAITELTTSMVKNIQQMGLAQRSFLSMQTGGPGGLRGGYEIELLKAQGKFDEIQKKTDQALRKQFGGRVVTLEEASRDEGAARQLAKQVQLVTSGPTKVVDTEAQAYKLFEAMRSGAAGGKAITGADALESTMKKGEGIQELQTSILTDISNDIEHVAFNTNIMAKQASGDTGEMISTAVSGAKKTAFGEKAIGDIEKYGLDISGKLGTKEEKEQRRTRASLEASAVSYNNPFRAPSTSITDMIKEKFKDLIEPKVNPEEAAKNPEAASAFAAQQQQQVSFDLAPESLSIPLQGRKGLAPSDEVRGILDSYNQRNAPQKRANAPEGERNQHTVTIVLQNPDGRELKKTILNIVDGKSSLDRTASTIGASPEPNPM
jgi:hypothetical protein